MKNKDSNQRFNINTFLNIVNAIVLSMTLFVVSYYTIETTRLRRLSQEQIRRNSLPIVIMKSDDHISYGQGGGNIGFRLKNVGTGPAFNISISDIVNDEYKAHFKQVTALEVNGENGVYYDVFENTGPQSPYKRTDMRTLAYHIPPHSRKVGNGFDFTIIYSDAHNLKYEVKQRLSVPFDGGSIEAQVVTVPTMCGIL